MSHPILPGAILGMFGGGQLGRMFTLAAKRMGYRVHIFSPEVDSPAGQVADAQMQANYDDADALANFARGVAAVTFEFENIPIVAAEVAARFVPVRPSGEILYIAQNRIREKTFLREQGIPIAPLAVIRTPSDLENAVRTIGVPSVLKTADSGYDGKGQVKITAPDAAAAAWRTIGEQPAVLEGFVEFAAEASVIIARGVDGEIKTYGPIRNIHRHHILDVSVLPSGLSKRTASRAVEIARTIAERLRLVGVLCVEFFVLPSGDVLVNELAPRPHNSGHLTIEGCVTSQFEQQVRTLCGLPLGSNRILHPTAMANLLGDLWSPRDPNWTEALRRPGAALHLYGKTEARPGRKMGHITAQGDSPRDAVLRVRAARKSLSVSPS